MNRSKARQAHLFRNLLLAGTAIALALGACIWDPPPQPHAIITLCAQDPAQGACPSGDVHTVGDSQGLIVKVTEASGKPMANSSIRLSLSGANALSHDEKTGQDGTVTYTYTGAQAGDDRITASIPGNSDVSVNTALIVHWLTHTTNMRPIVWVHGTNEDAADFNTQLHPAFTDADQQGDTNEQTFTSLIRALTIKYDPRYLEAFCYVDDRAYDHSGAPSGCRFPLTPGAFVTQCSPGVSSRPCESQSSVDENALQLSRTVAALSAEAATAGAGTSKVTLIGYSMGGAVMRTFLAGCPLAATTDRLKCADAVNKIDQVFFVDGDQQGAWPLTINQGLDASTMSGDSSIPSPITPFKAALPLLQQVIYEKMKSAMGLDIKSQAVADQTPQSASIQAHDQYPLPTGIAYYNFFGDIQIQLGVTYYGLPLAPAQPTLNLGDLLILAQDDRAQTFPVWGGAGLCDGCTAPLDQYREFGAYHNWILIDKHALDMSFVADLLNGSTDPKTEAGKIFNSPVQHLNVTQPPIQAPGSSWQLHDITGHGDATDMSTEIFYIIAKQDGLALP